MFGPAVPIPVRPARTSPESARRSKLHLDSLVHIRIMTIIITIITSIVSSSSSSSSRSRSSSSSSSSSSNSSSSTSINRPVRTRLRREVSVSIESFLRRTHPNAWNPRTRWRMLNGAASRIPARPCVRQACRAPNQKVDRPPYISIIKVDAVHTYTSERE